MYRTECDWCHNQIHTSREQYVEVSIEVVTHETDHLQRPKNEQEPTRFFHVAPRRSCDEWDRLGLEVRSEDIGDCCYTRALRAIEGTDFDEPDAGFEWRLVPLVDGPLPAQAGDPRGRAGLDDDLHAFLQTLAPSPRFKLRHALADAGITTLTLASELTDDELLAVNGIGPTLVRKLRAFVAQRNGVKAPKVRA
jgi:hypothetical protein